MPSEKENPLYGSNLDVGATIRPGEMSPEETAALREKLRHPLEEKGPMEQLIDRIQKKENEFKAEVEESIKGITGTPVEVVGYRRSQEDPDLLEVTVRVHDNGSEEKKFVVKRPE